MALFTVILEFDGGTYISQVRTSSVQKAISKYASLLVLDDGIPGKRAKKLLAVALAEEVPVPLNGVRNVWCCSTVAGDRFALVNIVSTAG